MPANETDAIVPGHLVVVAPEIRPAIPWIARVASVSDETLDVIWLQANDAEKRKKSVKNRIWKEVSSDKSAVHQIPKRSVLMWDFKLDDNGKMSYDLRLEINRRHDEHYGTTRKTKTK